jgi:hypothetical protein
MPSVTGAANRFWRRGSSVAPGLGLGVLAKFSCSMCLGAYVGVLSSMGLGFVATDAGLLALTVFFVVLGTASIAWSSRRHRQWGPVLVAAVGGVLVTVARVRAVDSMLYVGAALVTAAALWNIVLGLWRPRQLVPLVGRAADRTRTTP